MIVLTGMGPAAELRECRSMQRSALLAAFVSLFLVLPIAAKAGVVAQISISSQRMTVYVNGQPRHSWPAGKSRP